MNKELELKTISVLALASLIVFAIFRIETFLVISLCLLILGFIGGKPSYYIAKSWMKFAHALGKINTAAIIFLSYCFCLAPLALIYRFFNKKAVNDFFGKKENTYFKEKNKKYTKKDLQALW